MNKHSFLLGLAAITATALHAGPEAKAPVQPQPKKDAGLLTFFDGALVLDLEERLRFEVRNNNRDFNDRINDNNDDSWLLNRFRFGLAVKPARWLKLYAQVQDVREWDSDRANIPGISGAEGDDEFDLRQAYVEFADYSEFPLGLTVGRQGLNYGDRRLIADSQWGNFGRTFDAVKLRLQQPKWWVEAFFGRPVQIKTEVFDNNDAADNVAGLYFSNDFIPFQTTDLYVIYRDKGDNQPDLSPANSLDPRGTFNGPAARFTTFGVRFDSKPGQLHGWDYNVEAAYQNGDLWSSDRNSRKLDLHAFAAHAAVGYTFEDAGWKPRLGVEYNYASGDRNADDGSSQSFQNLLPSNHDKYGLMDEFGWRNLHDARAIVSIKPVKKVEVSVSYHAFWLADTSDYWYRSNGNSTLRTKTPAGDDVRRVGADNFAGQEVDLFVRWSPREYLKFDAGYSHFFAGNYLSDTGTSDDADFGYVQATLKF